MGEDAGGRLPPLRLRTGMEGIRNGTSRAPSPTRVRWKWYDAIVGAIHESPAGG